MVAVCLVVVGCSATLSPTGSEAFARYQVRVMRDAIELEVVGALGENVAARVREQLDAHPTVVRIHLNSEGGNVIEARALAALIEGRGLNTYTASGCSGACILPFAAGRLRLINYYASLGFYAYAFPGPSGAVLVDENRQDRAYLIRRGVQAEFVERALGTPAGKTWTPAHAELIAAGIVTRRSFVDEVAVTGIDPDQPASMDKTLTRNPVFRALKEVEPHIYADLVADVADAYRNGRTTWDVIRKVDPRIRELREQRLPHASDETLLRLYKSFVTQLEVLQRVDSKLCIAYAMAPNEPLLHATLQELVSEDLHRESLLVTAAVLRTGRDRAHRLTDEAAAERSAAKALASLRRRYGNEADILQQTTALWHDTVTACRMSIAYLREVLDLPSPEAAATVRYFVTDR